LSFSIPASKLFSISFTDLPSVTPAAMPYEIGQAKIARGPHARHAAKTEMKKFKVKENFKFSVKYVKLVV